MKRTIIAILAASAVITGATAVSASGMHHTGMHHMGMRHKAGVYTAESCPNSCQSVYGECHSNTVGHHRGHCEINPEYCPYR